MIYPINNDFPLRHCTSWKKFEAAVKKNSPAPLWTIENGVKALREGQIRGYLTCLTNLSELSTPQVIAALSPRKNTGLVINFKESTALEGHPLWMASDMTHFSDIQGVSRQIAYWQPNSKNVKAQRASVWVTDKVLSNYMESKTIHPLEIVPPAGYGVEAVVVGHEDLEFRKVLAQCHSQETSKLTNIERKIQFNSSYEETNVMVNQDGRGRYHLYIFAQASDHVIREHIIQNSHVGLIEKAMTILT